MTDRQTKPLNSSRLLEISRTNFREQVSRLEIRELNLILPVPVPENGNGKIKKLMTLTHGKLAIAFPIGLVRPV